MSSAHNEERVKLQRCLVRLLLWTKVAALISQVEWVALERFGARYGQAALVNRFWGLVKARLPQDLEAFVRDIFLEADQASRVMVAGRLIASSPSRTSASPKRPRKNAWSSRFAKSIQPLLRVVWSLEFWASVMQRYFTPLEQQYWLSKITSTSGTKALSRLVAELESRSRQKLPSLMRSVGFGATDTVTALLVDTARESRQLFGRRGEVSLSSLLENGDIAGLTALYQKTT